MAKGFTVKAKAPQKKNEEPEWDYDKAREMLRGKAIVFCMPGRGCSYQFLKSFLQLIKTFCDIWDRFEFDFEKFSSWNLRIPNFLISIFVDSYFCDSGDRGTLRYPTCPSTNAHRYRIRCMKTLLRYFHLLDVSYYA